MIFGAIKNRRIYVFHEEPLMDEDYTAARALKIRIPLLFKNASFLYFLGSCNITGAKTNIDKGDLYATNSLPY